MLRAWIVTRSGGSNAPDSRCQLHDDALSWGGRRSWSCSIAGSSRLHLPDKSHAGTMQWARADLDAWLMDPATAGHIAKMRADEFARLELMFGRSKSNSKP